MGLFSKALSVISPVNALAGGVIGKKLGLGDMGIGGLGSKFKSMTGTNRATSGYEQSTMDVINMLKNQAQGKGPSLVEEQAKQAQADNLKNTVSAIRSSSGLSDALKAKMASDAGQGQGARIARDKTLGQLSERLESQKNLANVVTGVRGQDLDSETARAKRKGELFTKVAEGVGSAFGLGS